MDGSSITYGGGNGNSLDKFIRTNTETVAGQDANFKVDGVSISRSANIVDDVIFPCPLVISKEFIIQNKIDIVVHSFFNKEDFER